MYVIPKPTWSTSQRWEYRATNEIQSTRVTRDGVVL